MNVLQDITTVTNALLGTYIIRTYKGICRLLVIYRYVIHLYILMILPSCKCIVLYYMCVFHVVKCIVAYRSGIESNPAKGTYVHTYVYTYRHLYYT